MSDEHLKEEQFQQYALDNLTDIHVRHCIHCQQQIKVYQLLYSHIREEAEPVLDFNPAAFIPAPKNNHFKTLISATLAILLLFIGACWRWLLSDIATVIIVFSLLFIFGFVSMQILELYHIYRKNNILR